MTRPTSRFARAALVALALGASGVAAFGLSLSAVQAAGGGGGSSGGGGGGGGGSSGGGGGGGSGGSGGSSGGNTSGLNCGPGWTPHPSGQYCVKAQSFLDEEQLYEEGRALALAGNYADALVLLGAADQSDSMVLTMIGYATRKSGAVEEGIGYYHRALALNPDNVNTREYLGEGYVMLGRLDLAQGQLDRIEAICGADCDQYLDLAAAMAGDEDWTHSTN